MTNLYKIMFSSMVILGTMLTISYYSWVSMWMALEMNLLSIIPLMSSNKGKLTSESSLKYFITKTIASWVLLHALILLWLHNPNNEWLNKLPSSLIILSLMMKMGAAPFHFWFPEIMEGLIWINSLIMMTWQKIAPFMILMYIPKHTNMVSANSN